MIEASPTVKVKNDTAKKRDIAELTAEQFVSKKKCTRAEMHELAVRLYEEHKVREGVLGRDRFSPG